MINLNSKVIIHVEEFWRVIFEAFGFFFERVTNLDFKICKMCLQSQMFTELNF